jgi:hypothetical protein
MQVCNDTLAQTPKEWSTPETLHRGFYEHQMKLTGCSIADMNSVYSRHQLATIGPDRE